MIITVVAIKGGVGKTTTTFCLAAALSRLGKRVLCIDLDPQGDLSVSLGHGLNASDPPIGQVLNAPKREQASLLYRSILTVSGWTDLVTPGENLSDYEKELAKGLGPDLRLRDALEQVKQQYDVILLDTSKGDGLLVTNALVACDQIVVPVQMEWLALHNLPRLMNQLAEIADRLNPHLRLSMLIPSQLKRTSLSKQVHKSLLEWNPLDYLPHQRERVWVSPPVHELTLYAELAERGIPIYDHPGVSDKHLEPFEAIARQIEQQLMEDKPLLYA